MDNTGNYFIETIKQGAFKRAIEKAEKIDILLDHMQERVLGDTTSNLELHEDEIGLHAHVVIDDPEVVEKAKSERLRGWSFGFSNPIEVVGESDGMRTRAVTDLTLHEVSLIDDRMTPAYKSTSVEVRADGENVEIRAFDSDFVYLVRTEEKTPEIDDEPAPEPYNCNELKEFINKYK